MTKLDELVTLGPEEEADRLWNGAVAASEQADENLIALCECLDLGLRAAEILIVQRLQAVRGDFPGTIANELETPVPDVDVERDAVSAPKTIQFTEMLDLLSADGLDCVGPRLHRGWEDRRFSCARSRDTARKAVGLTLDEPTRERLMLLSAYRNRLFRCCPPVTIEPGRVIEAYPALVELVESLRIG